MAEFKNLRHPSTRCMYSPLKLMQNILLTTLFTDGIHVYIVHVYIDSGSSHVKKSILIMYMCKDMYSV